jgi:hypothetical protein
LLARFKRITCSKKKTIGLNTDSRVGEVTEKKYRSSYAESTLTNQIMTADFTELTDKGKKVVLYAQPGDCYGGVSPRTLLNLCFLVFASE